MTSQGTVCREVAVVGLRKTSVALPAYTSGAEVEVAVELWAEANATRRTVVTDTTRPR